MAWQPSAGTGVVLSWSPPAQSGGRLSSYRVYRGPSPTSLSLLTEVAGTGHHDTATTPRALYYYQVAAVNSAGEGPRSNLNRMVAR